MTYWETLKPTANQINAISTYEDYYDIKINITNKQQAHDVITEFMKDRELYFEYNKIKGTNVLFAKTETLKGFIKIRTDKEDGTSTKDIMSSFWRDFNKAADSVDINDNDLSTKLSDDYPKEGIN